MSTFYGVRRGRCPGVYLSWNECREQIWRYEKADFRRFVDFESAVKYVGRVASSGVGQISLRKCNLCLREAGDDENFCECKNKCGRIFHRKCIIGDLVLDKSKEYDFKRVECFKCMITLNTNRNLDSNIEVEHVSNIEDVIEDEENVKMLMEMYTRANKEKEKIVSELDPKIDGWRKETFKGEGWERMCDGKITELPETNKIMDENRRKYGKTYKTRFFYNMEWSKSRRTRVTDYYIGNLESQVSFGMICDTLKERWSKREEFSYICKEFLSKRGNKYYRLRIMGVSLNELRSLNIWTRNVRIGFSEEITQERRVISKEAFNGMEEECNTMSQNKDSGIDSKVYINHNDDLNSRRDSPGVYSDLDKRLVERHKSCRVSQVINVKVNEYYESCIENKVSKECSSLKSLKSEDKWISEQDKMGNEGYKGNVEAIWGIIIQGGKIVIGHLGLNFYSFDTMNISGRSYCSLNCWQYLVEMNGKAANLVNGSDIIIGVAKMALCGSGKLNTDCTLSKWVDELMAVLMEWEGIYKGRLLGSNGSFNLEGGISDNIPLVSNEPSSSVMTPQKVNNSFIREVKLNGNTAIKSEVEIEVFERTFKKADLIYDEVSDTRLMDDRSQKGKSDEVAEQIKKVSSGKKFSSYGRQIKLPKR